MEKNIGKVDAAIRIIVGIVALYLAFVYSLWWLIVAIIAFVTASTRSCFLYSLLGIGDKKTQLSKKGKRK